MSETWTVFKKKSLEEASTLAAKMSDADRKAKAVMSVGGKPA
jgi:hypothetical protein